MREQRELDPLACFLTACEIERREQRNVRRERTVVNGRLVSAERGRFFYRFDVHGDLELREDSSLQVIIGDAFYHGSVQAVSQSLNARWVTIALATHVGALIPSARVESQEQDLLQSLILRLRDVQSSGCGAGWNQSLAQRVLRLQPEPKTESDVARISAPKDLTADQHAALIQCMSQPVTYVWGPPGTGKTVLLAALALQLYQENKRVLIVSHTNHAVDGVLENLCQRITERGRSAIPEGSILRVGTIVRNSLQERFGDQVCIDSVINRNHDKVSGRLATLMQELAHVRDELFTTSKRISLLDTYRQLCHEIALVRNGDWFSAARPVLRELGGSGWRQVAKDGGSFDEYASFIEENLAKVSSEIEGCDKLSLEERAVELSGRQVELAEAIAVLRKFIRDLRLSLLDRARIIATTATHAMLSERDINEFDAVLIDEASMLPLPLCYLLSGRARERVVVAGDFRQLPAVARSNSEMVKRWYVRDVFECSGVVDLIEQKGEHPSVVTLTTQFRSHETLCELVNNRFYGGILRTRTASSAERFIYRDPLAYLNRSPIVVVDTSELQPWGEFRGGSKQNLIHALVVRKLALLLSAHGMAVLPGSLGVIVPYRAQADLIRSLLEESFAEPTVSVGTVHKFQGSERDAILLDLTESPPHALGSFLNPESLRDTGARLLNVALSRARRHLLVVVNLKHLRAQLPGQSLMWGVLDDLERHGYYLPAARVIGEPIFPTPSREVCDSPGVLAFQAFDHSLFLSALVTDLLEATCEVVISTPRIGQREVTWIATVLAERVKQGVRVYIRVTESGIVQPYASGESIVTRLGRVGVVVISDRGSAPPAVVIDSEVVWVGSLAPLDSLSGSAGIMARTVSAEAATRTLEALQIEDKAQRFMAKAAV